MAKSILRRFPDIVLEDSDFGWEGQESLFWVQDRRGSANLIIDDFWEASGVAQIYYKTLSVIGSSLTSLSRITKHFKVFQIVSNWTIVINKFAIRLLILTAALTVGNDILTTLNKNTKRFISLSVSATPVIKIIKTFFKILQIVSSVLVGLDYGGYWGVLKYYTGLIWQKTKIKVYLSGSFVEKPLKIWKDGEWKKIDTTGQ